MNWIKLWSKQRGVCSESMDENDRNILINRCWSGSSNCITVLPDSINTDHIIPNAFRFIGKIPFPISWSSPLTKLSRRNIFTIRHDHDDHVLSRLIIYLGKMHQKDVCWYDNKIDVQQDLIKYKVIIFKQPTPAHQLVNQGIIW